MAFPSKSAGLYGEGLIFRSDSNGEDLGGYAGAGLYDSVLLTPPRPCLLDYSSSGRSRPRSSTEHGTVCWKSGAPRTSAA